MLLEMLCLIYYVTASIQVIPCMYRIWKRKSSEDYSLVSEFIFMISAMAWTAYIYLSEQTMVVYLGTAFDMLMAILYVFLIFWYHKPKSK